MPELISDGLALSYEVHGAGRPVVMLHGAAATFTANFAAGGWVDRFTSRGFRVVGLDARGHGGSAKPYDPERYGVEASTRDVVALLDELGIASAALVGYSIGSQIALHLLHTHADRFDAAALVATGDGLIGHPPYTFPAILPGLAETCGHDDPAGLPAGAVTYWMLATHAAGDRAAIAAFARGDFPPCSAEEAGTVDVPVLVISGENDTVLGTAPRLAAAIPKAIYEEIAGADHFTLAIDEKIQTAVADFLV